MYGAFVLRLSWDTGIKLKIFILAFAFSVEEKMNRLVLALAQLSILLYSGIVGAQPILGNAPNHKAITTNLAAMPLCFTENRGQ
jgi:hypothetical protein